jgi:hypothetical protein
LNKLVRKIVASTLTLIILLSFCVIIVQSQPILGASSTDVIVGVDTKLKLEASYDHVFHSLYLHVNLTDVDGHPVANETVDFYMRRNNSRLTEGWVSIGSSQSNTSGIGLLTLAFNVFSGNYSIRAHHKSNEDFGESEDISDITVPDGAVPISSPLYQNQVKPAFNSAASPQFSSVNSDGELVKNWGFEKRAYGPPYPCGGANKCQNWTTNNLGYRDVRGDIDGSGKCDWTDISKFGAAYGSQEGNPNWNRDADIDGSGKVDWNDLNILGGDYGRTANRLDGVHSWYTSGGGDYQMGQWLDSAAIQAVAGKIVMFSFYFYPESVASNGSQNNARAEIYYEYSEGVKTVCGAWVAPTEIKWWNACVAASLPLTTTAVEVIINGKPNFKAWVDSTLLSIKIVGNLTVKVSSESLYAVLPLTMNASCTVDAPVDALPIAFFLDHVNSTGFLAGGFCPVYGFGPPYLYKISFVWNPDVTGSHKVIVAVGSGTSTWDIIRLIGGMGIIASKEVQLEFQQCPSNIVIHLPQAIQGNILPITVAFSRPRPYEAQVTDLFSTYTLAPKITYAGSDYVIDEGVGSVPIKLYVYVPDQHCLLILQSSTNASGLASFFASLNFRDAYLTLSITAFLDNPNLLYNQSTAQQNITFTKVSVNDVPTAGSDFFKLNYTVNKPYQSNEVYVGVDNPIDVEVGAFDLPVWNASVSTVVAENITCFNATFASATIPGGSDYLRVMEVYDPLSPSQRIKIYFDTGQEVYVDSRGCARIPSGASYLFVMKDDGTPIRANLEFLKITLDQSVLTNDLGAAREMWKPAEVGTYLVQVKLPSSFSVVADFRSNVTQVNASVNFISYFDVVKRPIDLSLHYTPDQPTLDDNVTMTASCYDSALEKPANGVYVDLFIYGLTIPNAEEIHIYLGWVLTNSSGVATFSFVPRGFYQNYNLFPWFRVVAVCFETSCTKYCENDVLLDTRYPTTLEFLGNQVIYAPVGQRLNLSCRLVRADNGNPVVDRPIAIFENETLINNPNKTRTDPNGILKFGVTTLKAGLYFFRLQFWWGKKNAYDTLYQDYNNATFVIAAVPLSVFVLLDVQPRDFKPGTPITLTATVFNATTNQTVTAGFKVCFYWCDENGVGGDVGNATTDANGVASVVGWKYPGSGVYGFWASVIGARQLASSPVMLTVGNETQLSINVGKGEDYKYVISGRLLSEGQPVANKQITIKVNGAAVANVTTTSDGSYSVTLNLQPVENKPTDYQIQAVFYGDNALNLNCYATAPDGTKYALCTTLQYFCYKPSSQSASVTVEPQATQVTTPTQTPEQMQAEAKSKGWFSIRNEFTWWYPWYRMHFRITVGATKIDAGVSLLPGGSTKSSKGLDIFSQLNAAFVSSFVLEAGTLMGEYAAAKIGFWGAQPWIAAGAFVFELTEDAIILGSQWNNNDEMLAFGVANIIIGFIATQGGFATAFLKLLTGVTAPTMAALMLLTTGAIAAGGPSIRSPVDWVQVGLSFGFAALALAHWAGLM